MNLETAAEQYDVKLSTLRLMATRGDIETVKVGKRRYVTPEEMDRIFKGEATREPKARRASK